MQRNQGDLNLLRARTLRAGYPVFTLSYLKASGFAKSSKYIFIFQDCTGYWAVEATEETAMNGVWKKGPGKDLFDVLEKVGDLPGLLLPPFPFLVIHTRTPCSYLMAKVNHFIQYQVL